MKGHLGQVKTTQLVKADTGLKPWHSGSTAHAPNFCACSLQRRPFSLSEKAHVFMMARQASHDLSPVPSTTSFYCLLLGSLSHIGLLTGPQTPQASSRIRDFHPGWSFCPSHFRLTLHLLQVFPSNVTFSVRMTSILLIDNLINDQNYDIANERKSEFYYKRFWLSFSWIQKSGLQIEVCVLLVFRA